MLLVVTRGGCEVTKENRLAHRYDEAMRTIFSAAFGIIAISLCGIMWLVWQNVGQVWVVLPAWFCANATALVREYLKEQPHYLRKNSRGHLTVHTWVVMLPFLLFARTAWHLQRLLSKELAWNEVVPGLFIARRLLPGELPEGVKLVVDLTAEFNEPRAIREAGDYLCRPILDATAPIAVELQEIVSRIAEHAGPALVHCANGHGRSALVVAATLIQKGLAKDAADAIRQVKAARPAVRLNHDQKRALEEFSKSKV